MQALYLSSFPAVRTAYITNHLGSLNVSDRCKPHGCTLDASFRIRPVHGVP